MLSCLLQVVLLTIATVHGYNIPGSKQFHQSTRLYAGKHHARYGNFLDAVPRPISSRDKLIYERLGIKKTLDPDMKTGDELRRERTRNLKLAVNEFPVVLPPPIIMQKNWSEEEILAAMECLNLSYGKKTREELSDSQRIGVIDWDEFDKHAVHLIKDYGTPLITKKVNAWIKFHIKKRDVRFVVETWMWAPDRPGRKRLPKVKPVKAIGDLEKKDLISH